MFGVPVGSDGSSILSSRPTQDGDICNWSEAAARHSEVSSLLGSGLGTEDGCTYFKMTDNSS